MVRRTHSPILESTRKLASYGFESCAIRCAQALACELDDRQAAEREVRPW